MYALVAILAFALGAADVYRWTDANGQTHYSDQPQPGAKRVTINFSRPTASRGPAVGSSSNDGLPEPETPAVPTGYRSLIITSPAQEQVLWNIEGQLDVAAAVEPGLQGDHALRFSLDGQTATAPPGRNEARFTAVFRGEHSLQVDVVDGSGKALISSPPTRFYVRQTALPNPIP